ncbi:nucleotide exchange factor GrpE [Pseudobacteriovorax antillogorgiicola]|uniref:Protein GrpE n=1 Tax=Pseudobacteriovorax antillogorgiicola TaxID=1513793 RepID=A0A1Y6B621_9BACT|nr:nucleotide exchange factor GrpE [Pseudobacteriovorax antillogorgiicola]TCS59287.1 molecular chaperone GrpE [Pseudobacteriovorax antillogorgiicola]SME89721.1 molecular chaperone GrpE [Pseudobacteriovorax antillogorgiicola]
MEVNQESNQAPKSANDSDAQEDSRDNQDAKAQTAEVVDESSEQGSLQETVKKLEAENKELQNKFLRTVADMENLRRRHDKEKSDLAKYGNEKLLEDLLPVLDSFEKALATGEGDESQSYVEGVKMVFKQLTDMAEKHGLTGFESQGEEFDPNLHQGIQRIEDESVETERVKDVFQKGYMLNERLLRPAVVSVAVPATKD